MVYSRIKREKLEEAREKITVGPVFLTRYERARIIGARALQISLGAPILTDISGNSVELDSMKIAEKELLSGILPLTIRRTLPSGKYQDIPLSWLYMED
ncbi:MAG: DNA-directed RNA polymerase subunit K [Candidatus Lokiarchaeota archaeon]|nr:DNA-directed RNA polymerase subunit K [Candidatus Lokiarchaeota archaeon]